ncbi:hypothetical protein [Halobacterium yunchengense]|uniref:hypothetical protein n=1 Tax=Halobacterium yunchengense TaxID=3108497 RepID=UPI003009D703
MSQPRADVRSTQPSEYFDPINGFVKGVAAFLGTYAAMVGLLYLEVTKAGGSVEFPLLLAGALEWAYAAHYGAVSVETVFSSGASLSLPGEAYYVVPAFVLLWRGRELAADRRLPDARAAAVRGSSVVVGYAVSVLAAQSALTAVLEAFADASGDPALAVSLQFPGSFPQLVAVAGLAYPVVLGAVGGILAYQRHN